MTIFTKPRKYRNQPVTVDGVRYDSKAEARYAQTLHLRMRAREVAQVERQVPFSLLTQNGQLVGTYRADFVFWDDVEGRQRVIDVKGFDTPLSRWKRKHVKAQYGIEVEIVK